MFSLKVLDISKGHSNEPVEGLFSGKSDGIGANVTVPNFDDENYLQYASGIAVQQDKEYLENKGYEVEILDSRIDNLDPTVLNPSARPVGTGTIRVSRTILPETNKLSKVIGNGNYSAGIDMAVAFYAQQFGLL